MNMKALRFTLAEKKLELSNISIPTITKPNEVLVKVSYCGVCGTDLHMMQGEYPVSEETVTLGHEFSGIVAVIGEEVKAVKVGDRVAVDPNRGCHSCNFCHSGDPHFCTKSFPSPGCWCDGGWADYVLVAEESVYVLPEAVTLQQGALVEPLSCLTHGWDIISPVTVGTKILIVGAGIIGNLWVCNLHQRGHKNVTVSEPNAARLNLLKNLNTGYNLITPQQLQENHQADPNYRFDLIIDCSGYAPATEHAATLLQIGGKYCIFGVAPPNAEIKLNIYEITYNEYNFFGVKVNPYSFPKAIGLVEAMGERYLDLTNLGVKVFKLEEYKEALEYLKKGTISKAMFKLS